MRLRNQAASATSGYVMAAMLVAIGVMTVLMTVAMPVWRHEVQREKEEELVFRGQQYVRAIALFQRKYAASFPPSVDVLVAQKFLRKKYKDPMTKDGEFQVLYQMATPMQPARTRGGRGGAAGAVQGAGGGVTQGAEASGTGALGPRGGIIGVASKSTGTSIRLYNGRDHYNEWQFVFVPTMLPGQGGARPGMRGGQRGFERGGTERRGFGQETGPLRPGTSPPVTPGQGQRGPG